MNGERKIFFNSVTGEMRFDESYPGCCDIPKAIKWPCEKQRRGKEYGFKNLTLALTMKCNMVCDYCWQQHNHIPDMTPATIDAWVDFFINDEANNPHKVLYYGGEPLIRLDLIEHAASRIRETCRERDVAVPEQHIFTNGTLLDDERIGRLQEAGVYIIVSIDGDESHNAFRRLPDESSAHATVMRNVKRLSKLGIPFGICCTISSPAFDVGETVGYLLEKASPSSFELNIRHDRAFKDVVEDYKEPYLNDFEQAWDVIEAHGVKCIDLRKRVSALADRIPLQNSSSGSKNKLSIMPDGKVSTFNGAVSFPELQIEPSGTWIEEFKRRWSRSVLSMPECATCEAVFICGQGSAFSSYLQYGDFDHVPALHCKYCRTVLQYVIEHVENTLDTDRLPKKHVITGDEVRAAFPALFDGNGAGKKTGDGTCC